MSHLLKICSVPTDSLGETNHVYIHPSVGSETMARHIAIGGIVYTVSEDARVEPSQIAMNLIQRRASKVSTAAGDTAELRKGGHVAAADSIAVSVDFLIEYVSGTKRGGVLDYAKWLEYARSKFDGQYLCEGQMILVVHEGAKYIATVTKMDGIGHESAAVESAMLVEQTTVSIKTLEKCDMQVTNIPDAVQDAQQPQLVQSFDLQKLGIGGLRAEFGQVFRRAFASRIFPQSLVKKLGIHHVKGLLLHGPPGTGKTLIARKLGQVLNCKEPKIVNGPEIFSKFVGVAEENIRKLFADAEVDQEALGDRSPLHLIIFDEFDAICKQRGGRGDSTGVGDNVVNQLLSKIDGVVSLNNVLLIGMTNRKDLIDEAILRPGRFEVHVEIGLPEKDGRVEILNIHTQTMKDNEILGADFDIDYVAAESKNFSGAELEGLVRSAQSHAFARHIDFDNPTSPVDPDAIKIGQEDFIKALAEIKPAFGRAEDECKSVLRNGIIAHGREWDMVARRTEEFVRSLKQSKKLQTMSVLVTGANGSGKSAVAAHMAMQSEFPYAKFVSTNGMVGYGEMQKANILRKAFEDAYKSNLSVVVLDDLERLVEYSQLGGRYSNVLLQTLLVLIKRPPPDGKKLLVIGTSGSREVMDALELGDCFESDIDLPPVEPAALGAVVMAMGIEWRNEEDIALAADAMPRGITIKKLITLVEMAVDDEVEGSDKRYLTFRGFADAVMLR